MGLIDKIKNKLVEPTKNDLYEVELYINSAYHFQEDIKKYVSKTMPVNNRYILETASEYSMVAWEYDTCRVKHYKFEKDTKNENDPNAIKIIASTNLLDAYTIGFIPKEENIKFGEWLDKGMIYNVNIIISGGNKKIIATNSTIVQEENYKVILKVLVRK